MRNEHLKYSKHTPMLVLTFFLSGCMSPYVSMKVAGPAPNWEFQFESRHIDGLESITIWEKESGRTLWAMHFPYFRGATLRYGEIPSEYKSFNGVKQRGRQEYPANNEPAIPLPVEREIIVALSYVYDALDLCFGNQLFAFKVRRDGTIEKLAEGKDFDIGHGPDIYKRQ